MIPQKIPKDLVVLNYHDEKWIVTFHMAISFLQVGPKNFKHYALGLRKDHGPNE